MKTGEGKRPAPVRQGRIPSCRTAAPLERGGMLVAWTTVAQRPDADRLAAEAVRLGLAACVQIEGPITSHYRWDGKLETAQEFRLCFKFPAENAPALERHIHAIHPYETPEWIVVEARHVSEKYLSWAKTNSSSRPL